MVENIQNDSDGDDEEVLDWAQFLSAKSTKKQPFIPKRGEKDFEPLAAPEVALSQTESLLSAYQLNLLQKSRNALFTALDMGVRQHSSRNYNSFTWRPDLDGGKATCDLSATHGIHFLTVGLYSSARKQLELLPEEAIYLVERGVIELWDERVNTDGQIARTPMSVQQAWSLMMGHQQLTVERYQVYVYLKRLGYVVIRARPSVQDAPAAHPSLLSWLLNTIKTVMSSFIPTKGTVITRQIKRGEGILKSLLYGRSWGTYHHMFGHLQIIPTGWGLPLPRKATARIPNSLEPVSMNDENTSLTESPYQVFWHVYKPVTKYRKSAPPPPDFRVVVINAVTTSLPTVFELEALFNTIPPPVNAIEPPRPKAKMQPKKALNATSTNVASTPSTWARIFPWLAQKPVQVKKESPYPRLKTGKRTAVFAVVDNGTTSFMRFSEGEFGQVPWWGEPRER